MGVEVTIYTIYNGNWSYHFDQDIEKNCDLDKIWYIWLDLNFDPLYTGGQGVKTDIPRSQRLNVIALIAKLAVVVAKVLIDLMAVMVFLN